MQLTPAQLRFMEADGHILVTGGPGSGKTTAAIHKAASIAERELRPYQDVLFLSFARATVSRVLEAIEAEQDIALALRKRIEVDTYHAFFWRLIQTHGYLLGLPRRLEVLPPPAEAVALSAIRSRYPARGLAPEEEASRCEEETAERKRLALQEGRVSFELFAPYTGDLLHGSKRVRMLVRAHFPAILLDEFQDTSDAQWRVVEALGLACRLIALADPEQRIYDFIGASPHRLDHFSAAFSPQHVDLGSENHRSAGTDIARFGNALMTGTFDRQDYCGIVVDHFPPYRDPAFSRVVTHVHQARRRVARTGTGWSVALLVPTKKLARLASDALRSPPGGVPSVRHTAAIETEGAILAAEVIAFLLQPPEQESHYLEFFGLLCSYFQGKGGDRPSAAALAEATRIRTAYTDYAARCSAGKAIRTNSVVLPSLEVYAQARQYAPTGKPAKDWSAIRDILEQGSCKRLREVAAEARNVRLLNRTAELRQALSQDWRDNGTYSRALTSVRTALAQEHFSTTVKPEQGVVVMNMHKAKGKQFDEVVIFEGWPVKQANGKSFNADRIVRLNSPENVDDQSRQTLRVSVTRAKLRTTILTPSSDPCVLLPRKRA